MVKPIKTFQCHLCKQHFEGFGNNPYPLCDEDDFEARCCNDCDNNLVIPERLKRAINQR